MSASVLPGDASAGLPATDAEVVDFETRLNLGMGKWNSPDPEMLRTETRRLGRAVLARLRVAEARCCCHAYLLGCAIHSGKTPPRSNGPIGWEREVTNHGGEATDDPNLPR